MSIEQGQAQRVPPAHRPPGRVRLTIMPQRPCPYLPGRLATDRAFHTHCLSPEMYHDFMDAGFRRSGGIVYQPVCRGCRACVPIRVPAQRFSPSRTQRRVWKKNADLRVTIRDPIPTDEKHDLFRRYLLEWHDDSMSADRDSFAQFLYSSPVDTIEFTYRDADGRLLAVGLCDRCSRSLSSVYFYFDPAHARRRLGTYGILYEIDFTRRQNIPWYYLGYWVAGSRTMEYKREYRPNEILHSDGIWRAVEKHGLPESL